MPKRTDIESILVLGAGPIVIGQACEFDYSGTQALRALREEGYRTILVNSNPATIMTDPDLADRTYIEPLTLEFVTAVIEKEKPDALLPTVGGQTALNLARELFREGILESHEVILIGAQMEAIETAENRETFKEAMDNVGIATAKGGFVRSDVEAHRLLETMDFPVIIRPSYTLGGSGGATAYNQEEFTVQIEQGLDVSPIHEVLIEESLLGWKEFELEVIRDKADNAVVVCSIENVDPMGVHTGDSITVAPAMTLTDREYQSMRDWALLCLRTVGVETGGSNVQFAVHPKTGRMVVIEMNPRVSRSSALASKATGFPIAKIAAKLAVGYTLDELPNEITGKTWAAFEPVLDYVVTKIPRFDFEKFPSADGHLGVQMQSVGEVMAIGRTFRESMQKAFRSLEKGFDGFSSIPPAGGDTDVQRSRSLNLDALRTPTSFRLLKIREGIRQGMSLKSVQELTGIDPWFLDQIRQLDEVEAGMGEYRDRDKLKSWKRDGFSDRQIAEQTGREEFDIREWRKTEGILPVFNVIDTCAAEFSAATPYAYATYESEQELTPLDGESVLILGGGPNRIGQGIEFDYCCVQAVFGLRDLGLKTIMLNCNPETVSTDYDLSHRLYFEPVTLEDVLNVVEFEQPAGVLVQFGGQTPLKIARGLQAAGVPVWGTSPVNIDLAEDREKFGKILAELDIPCPAYGVGTSVEEVVAVADRIGYPVLARPSYVLGGRAMEIVYSQDQLVDYIARNAEVTAGHPLFIDQFLEDAFEFDVDALSDGVDVYIGGILQHIEECGIHSGDSSCVLPPYKITPQVLSDIRDITGKLARRLEVKGLLNLQFAWRDHTVYVLEVNPRASRTVPFVSKATQVPLARFAAQLASGRRRIRDLELPDETQTTLTAIKMAVLPFNKFPTESIFLGPEMKSTGEVMGLAPTLGDATRRAMVSAGQTIPGEGRVFLSVNDRDKLNLVPIARDLQELGFSLVATRGTTELLSQNGVPVTPVFKVGEGRPHVVDEIKNGTIQLVINTPLGQRSRFDEEAIGRACIRYNIPAITTLSGAEAALRAIRRTGRRDTSLEVRALQKIL